MAWRVLLITVAAAAAADDPRLRRWTAAEPLVQTLSPRVDNMKCVLANDLFVPPHPTMCTYGHKEHVSKSYLHYKRPHTYESKYVTHFLQALALMGPDAGFLDVGSNFGTFGVHMAMRGHPTVMIDANRDNLYLAHNSMLRSGIRRKERVHFLNHAVWPNSMQTLAFNYTGDGSHRSMRKVGRQKLINVGGLAFKANDITSTPASPDWRRTRPGGGVDYVPTLSLDDVAKLLPFKTLAMKLDVNGGELSCIRAARRFFDVLDVRLLMYERPFPIELDTILRKWGYVPYASEGVEFIRGRVADGAKALNGANYTHSKVVFWYKTNPSLYSLYSSAMD